MFNIDRTTESSSWGKKFTKAFAPIPMKMYFLEETPVGIYTIES